MFEATPITLEDVHATAHEMLDGGWRFLTESVVDLGESFDILYHFDREADLRHFRLTVPKNTIVPSISGIYFAALLVENENRDFFGIEYDGLVLDFNRTFYLEEAGDPMHAPLCKISTYKITKSEG